jgi:nucleoside triphosphate diphosphatase
VSDPGAEFQRLYSIVARLRAPDGCPWDRKQTPNTMRPFLIEEIYELFEALDDFDDDHAKEELGDVLMLVTMIAYMREQESSFRVVDVVNEVCEKLVRRHPHVFGEVRLNTSDEVVRQWDEIKGTVEGRGTSSKPLLDKVPKALPPLERATRLQERASSVGFDWREIGDVEAKVQEELRELDAAIEGNIDAKRGSPSAEIEAELGDLLFSLANLARFLGVDPAIALHRTNVKFSRRFAHVEAEMRRRGVPMSQDHLEEMDSIWNEAKDQA